MQELAGEIGTIGQAGLTLSLGSSGSSSTGIGEKNENKSSTLRSEQDIAIQAGNDLAVIASEIKGNNVTLTAGQDLTLTAGQNNTCIDTKEQAQSVGIGATLTGTGPGHITGSYTNSRLNGKETATTHTPTVVIAKETLTLTSGQDTTLNGAQAGGNKIEIRTGGNLTLASLQDTATYQEHSQGTNLSIGGGIQGGINKGKMNSDYASVTNQTGLYTGKQGFDITVKGNTDLKGAVIASSANPEKNKLTTGTLTWSDIHNKAAYEASSFGVAYDSKKYQKTDKQNYKNQGLHPVMGATVEGYADSVTHSGIANGKIPVTDKANQKQDLATLNRNYKQSINVLGKIFNKQTVQEQQELINKFSEMAYDAIGNMKLKEGSPEKAAVDAVMGGILSKMNGSGFASGAASSGLSQLAMTQIMKIKDSAMQQWVATFIGAIAADMTGGSGNVGAFVALTQIRNNWLSHWQQQQRQAAIDSGDWEKVVYWDFIDKAQDQVSMGMGINPNQINWENPVNAGLLKTISEQAQVLAADPDFQNSWVVNRPDVDSSTLIIAGVIGTGTVVAGVSIYYYSGKWVQLGSSATTSSIIAGYKGNTSHIINGSNATTSGHAWEVFFKGAKPTFDKVEPYIANVIEKGTVTRTQDLPNGGTIVYKSLNINGFEVWVKEFIQNGVSRLSDAGVNNW